MQEDVRRILKVAAPFAGVALGWYLFLPNFRVLALTGQYRSQLLINIQQLTEAGSNLRLLLRPKKSGSNAGGKPLRSGRRGPRLILNTGR